ncbi:MAG: long-chain fatty acid--CoA ligase [Bacteroidetes bacterium]|nr:MAG: long-chain fatty acid--CoA ligase [Bacteroidota bacterium]
MIEKNFIKMYEESLINNWDLPALSDYQGDIFSYRDLAVEIRRLHMLYEAAGVKKGDKIAVFGKNSARWCISFMSIISYGAVVVPILSDFKPADVHTILNHSDACLLLTDKQSMQNLSEDEIKEVRAILAIDDFSILSRKPDKALKTAYEGLDKAFAKQYPEGYRKEDVKFAECANSELVEINYTSGTTGFSKGVLLSGNSLAGNVDFAIRHMELNPGERMLALLPLAHSYGCAFDFLFPMALGVHVTILGKLPATPVIMKAFAEVKPHLILFVPIFFEKLYKKRLLPTLQKGHMKVLTKIPGINAIIYRSIRKKLTASFGGNFREVVLGGAALSAEVEAFMRRIRFPFTIGYGMTECGPLISYAGWKTTRKTSSGKILDIMELKIDSSDPYNEPGEILIRGVNLMEGYYKDEENTKAAIDEEGWLHTGDVGVTDKDGFIYIKGRSKSMLLGPSGQNIYPEEIEARLVNMPYVNEAVVLMNSNHRLEALVNPDYDQARADGVEDQLEAKMEENRKEINLHLKAYEALLKIHIHEREFEKTPKRSIRRFLYKLEG